MYESFDAHGDVDINVLSSEGGIPRTLLPADGFAQFLPIFSPDGHWIYFASNRFVPESVPPFAIFRVPFAGGEPELVSQSATNEIVVSPTGDVYFYRGTRVWREGASVPIVNGVEWLQWDVFDDGICYIRAAREEPIECYRFSTGEIQPVTELGHTHGRGLSVSRDGRFIYYTHDELDSSDIMKIDGVFTPR